jgi:hypothetical protein
MARRRHHGLPAESATAVSGRRGVDDGSEAMGVAGRRRWRGASDTRGRERTAVRLQTAVVGGARGEAVDGGTFEQRRCRNGAVGWRLYGAGAWHERSAWQPRGESTLTGGPSVGSGG